MFGFSISGAGAFVKKKKEMFVNRYFPSSYGKTYMAAGHVTL